MRNWKSLAKPAMSFHKDRFSDRLFRRTIWEFFEAYSIDSR